MVFLQTKSTWTNLAYHLLEWVKVKSTLIKEGVAKQHQVLCNQSLCYIVVRNSLSIYIAYRTNGDNELFFNITIKDEDRNHFVIF